jgi:hypothetical protein
MAWFLREIDRHLQDFAAFSRFFFASEPPARSDADHVLNFALLRSGLPCHKPGWISMYVATPCCIIALSPYLFQSFQYLNARRLVFMSDVPGLLRNPKDPSTLITHLQTSEVDALKKAGVVDKGMIPKVDSAVAAIRSGVEKVFFVDGRVPHSVLLEIFTDAGVGTEIVL